MKYIALLTRDEMLDFLKNFYLLDLCLQTQVIITAEAGQNTFMVTLEPKKPAAFLLEASFQDGILHHLDLSKKFRKKKSWWP